MAGWLRGVCVKEITVHQMSFFSSLDTNPGLLSTANQSTTRRFSCVNKKALIPAGLAGATAVLGPVEVSFPHGAVFQIIIMTIGLLSL
jgi:hypothetical protein